jgi:hypothetical protein
MSANSSWSYDTLPRQNGAKNGKLRVPQNRNGTFLGNPAGVKSAAEKDLEGKITDQRINL